MRVKVSRAMLMKFMMEQKYIPVRQTSLYNLYKRFGEGTFEPNVIWNASGTWKENCTNQLKDFLISSMTSNLQLMEFVLYCQ